MNIPYLENYIAKCKKNAQDCEEIRKQEYELAISRYTLNTIKLIRIIDVIYQYSTIQKKKKKEDIRNSSKLTIYFDAISGYCLNNNQIIVGIKISTTPSNGVYYHTHKCSKQTKCQGYC